MTPQPEASSYTRILVQIIGLIAITIFTFIGLIYIFNGSIIIAAVISVLVLLVLKIVTDFMVKQKKENFTISGPEYMLGGVHTILFIVLFPVTFHFLNIDFFRKTEVKNICFEKLSLLDTLKSQYNGAIKNKQNEVYTKAHTFFSSFQSYRSKRYLDSLDALLGAGTFSVGNPVTVDRAIKVAQDNLQEKYTNKDDNRLTEYVQKTLPVFNNWQIINVGYSYQHINEVFNDYNAEAVAKMPEFKTTLVLNDKFNFNNPFASLTSGSIGGFLLSLLISLAVEFCILIPYFLAVRPGGVKTFQPKIGPDII